MNHLHIECCKCSNNNGDHDRICDNLGKIQSTLIFVTAASYLKTLISLTSVDTDWEVEGGGTHQCCVICRLQ